MDEPPLRDHLHPPSARTDFPYPPAKTGAALARGTTPMPNALFDVVMPILSDTQLRVLLVVARSTLGWKVGDGRKERDWLSHRQLQMRTGRAGAAVSGAIDVLVKKGLLEVQDRSGEARSTTSARRAARGPLFYRLGTITKASNSESEVVFDRKWRDVPTSPSDCAEMPEVKPGSLESGSISEKRLHKAKTTKENGTKENKQREISLDLSSLGSEVLQVGEEQIARLLGVVHEEQPGIDSAVTCEESDENSTADEALQDAALQGVKPQNETSSDEVEAFLRRFRAEYASARPGQLCPFVEASERELLERYIESQGILMLERWLPAFFASEFGYVRRRSWSLGSYLNSLFVLMAKQERAGR